MPTTVKDILTNQLRRGGYDGLVSDLADCGCQLGALMTCGGPCDTCRPGFKGPDPDGEAEWLIYPTRSAAEEARSPTVIEDDPENEQ